MIPAMVQGQKQGLHHRLVQNVAVKARSYLHSSLYLGLSAMSSPARIVTGQGKLLKTVARIVAVLVISASGRIFL